MNPFLRILFPRLHRSLVWLRAVVGQPTNNTMPRLSTEEEIAVIEGAASLISTQRDVIADLREQLGALPKENAALTAALAAADAADAETDEKLSGLKGLLEPAQEPGPTPEA
jgi:MoxR-like ATPase